MKEKTFYTISGIGPRGSMQDAGIEGFNPKINLRWFIVCDGIGGQPKGDIAATITVERLHSFFCDLNVVITSSNISALCEKGLVNICNAFEDAILKDSSADNMGCTLCCLLITENKTYVLWAGDSRLFQFRKHELYYETIPHSLIFDLYRKSEFTKEEAEISSMNYLTGSMNVEFENIRWEIAALELKKNDTVVLCSDGVWGSMEYIEFISFLKKDNLENTAKDLKSFLKEYAAENYFGYFIRF